MYWLCYPKDIPGVLIPALSFSQTKYIKQMADGLQILQHYLATAKLSRKTKI